MTTDNCELAVLRAEVEALEKMINQRITLELLARDKDLSKAEVELARRLDLLNGEAERLRSMQATYVPREVNEAKHAEFEKAIVQLQMFQSNMMGRIAVIGGVSGILSGILTAMLVRLVAN